MTPAEIQTALKEELYRIAPEIELSEIDRVADLREEFDIDSIDFLTLVTALGKRFDLAMPEADYAHMGSFNELLTYLVGHLHD